MLKRIQELGLEKQLVLGCFIFLFGTLLGSAFFLEHTIQMTKYGGNTNSFDSSLPVGYSALSASSTAPTKIHADVKGSIYETGSNMTVFGACFDGDGYLLPNATASFTAWFPNGSVMLGPNATMTSINGSGRWLIHVTMNDTIGTYLTEIRCDYLGDNAVAYGEWQNPEWVKRIGDTQSQVNSTYVLLQNLSQNMSQFRNDTNNSFTQVLNTLSNLTVSITGGGVSPGSFVELQNQLSDLQKATWILDSTNPFFVLNSGVHNYTAVDVLSANSVAVVSSDGYMDLWDGETWVEHSQPTISYRGVSVLPSNTAYAWGVGSQAGVAVYSVNGGNATTPTLPGGAPSAFNDVRLYQKPNTPSGFFLAYLLGNNGSVYFSNDGAGTWSSIGALPAAVKGRISQVVENHGVGSQPYGYATLIGQGNQVMYDNGVSQTIYNVTGIVEDVGLKYYNLGYVAVKGASTATIYKFNGSALMPDYVINDSNIVPSGISVLNSNDVWVSTTDPSVLFHFDGYNWQYSGFGVSNFVSVMITFGNVSAGTGIHDISMSDTRTGYSVGTDGLILVFQSKTDAQLQQILAELSVLNASMNFVNASVYNLSLQLNATNVSIINAINNLNSTLNASNSNIVSLLNNLSIQLNATNASIINQINAVNSSISNQLTVMNTSILNYISAVNSSIEISLNATQTFLNAMNASIDFKLDNILNNVTFTNLYLQTTLFPLINGTYQNTLTILVDLGLISAQVNQTIQLQNTTLNIVNATDQKVDILINKSNRIHSWITQ